MVRKSLLQGRSQKVKLLKSPAICFLDQTTQSRFRRTASSKARAICTAASVTTNRGHRRGGCLGQLAGSSVRRGVHVSPYRPHRPRAFLTPERAFLWTFEIDPGGGWGRRSASGLDRAPFGSAPPVPLLASPRKHPSSSPSCVISQKPCRVTQNVT